MYTHASTPVLRRTAWELTLCWPYIPVTPLQHHPCPLDLVNCSQTSLLSTSCPKQSLWACSIAYCPGHHVAPQACLPLFLCIQREMLVFQASWEHPGRSSSPRAPDSSCLAHDRQCMSRDCVSPASQNHIWLASLANLHCTDRARFDPPCLADDPSKIPNWTQKTQLGLSCIQGTSWALLEMVPAHHLGPFAE